jgi:hypothetical protein
MSLLADISTSASLPFSLRKKCNRIIGKFAYMQYLYSFLFYYWSLRFTNLLNLANLLALIFWEYTGGLRNHLLSISNTYTLKLEYKQCCWQILISSDLALYMKQHGYPYLLLGLVSSTGRYTIKIPNEKQCGAAYATQSTDTWITSIFPDFPMSQLILGMST